jgi:hypothetical protein
MKFTKAQINHQIIFVINLKQKMKQKKLYNCKFLLKEIFIELKEKINK